MYWEQDHEFIAVSYVLGVRLAVMLFCKIFIVPTHLRLQPNLLLLTVSHASPRRFLSVFSAEVQALIWFYSSGRPQLRPP